MAGYQLPSQEVLRQLLDYDPDSGVMRWKHRGREWFSSSSRRKAETSMNAWNARYAGSLAFTSLHKDGYKSGGLLGMSVLAHRVLWALVYGEWPDCLDHINGNPSDNRIQNLRAVSQDVNNKNRRRSKSGSVLGVYQRGRRWAAYIGARPKRIHLGQFGCQTAAMIARKKAERELGYHPNHGREVAHLKQK